MKFIIYHNPRCRKSREALEILSSSKNKVEVVEYLKTALTKKDIEGVLDKLKCNPLEIIRKGEVIFKEKLKGKKVVAVVCGRNIDLEVFKRIIM